MRLNPTEKNDILRALNRVIESFDDDASTWMQQRALNHARSLIEDIEPQRRCADCLNCQAADGYCYHWQCAIPADWLEKGCDQWVEDIPF